MSVDNTQNKRNSLDQMLNRIVLGFSKKTTYFLMVIISIGLLIRLYYVPYELPISLDGITYFAYAFETSKLGHLPTGYYISNNGWPVFTSFFFYILNSDNFLDYVVLQRYLAIVISVLTIIPVYLLCKKFVENHFALLGATIFAFEPRLIQNSVAGLAEPLFILLGSVMLLFFFSNNTKLTYVSFSIAALFALVRSEGLLVIIPLSIMFFKKYWHHKKILMKFAIAIGIFLLTLSPMVYARIEATGQDGFINQYLGAGSYVSRQLIQGVQDDTYPYPPESSNYQSFYFIVRGLSNLIKFVGLALIPNFICFVPIAAILIAKNQRHKLKDYRIITMILVIIFLLIPAFWAYGRGIQEVRYIFVLFPIFTVISCYLIKRISFRRFGTVFILISSLILLASLTFLEFNKIDYEYEKETFLISVDIVKNTDIINADPIDGNYLKVARILQKWPNIDANVIYQTDKVSTSGFNSLEDFLIENKGNGLTHIVSDGKDHGTEFIKDIFYDDTKYPYLTKIYDSTEKGFMYHVKIYKMDYSIFDSIHNMK